MLHTHPIQAPAGARHPGMPALHNGKFIDSTEVHSGVVSGSDNSGPTA